MNNVACIEEVSDDEIIEKILQNHSGEQSDMEEGPEHEQSITRSTLKEALNDSYDSINVSNQMIILRCFPTSITLNHMFIALF